MNSIFSRLADHLEKKQSNESDLLDEWTEKRQHDNYYAPDTGFNHSEGGNY